MRVCVCVRACLSVFSSVTLRIDHALPRGPLLVVRGGGHSGYQVAAVRAEPVEGC